MDQASTAELDLWKRKRRWYALLSLRLTYFQILFLSPVTDARAIRDHLIQLRFSGGET